MFIFYVSSCFLFCSLSISLDNLFRWRIWIIMPANCFVLLFQAACYMPRWQNVYKYFHFFFLCVWRVNTRLLFYTAMIVAAAMRTRWNVILMFSHWFNFAVCAKCDNGVRPDRQKHEITVPDGLTLPMMRYTPMSSYRIEDDDSRLNLNLIMLGFKDAPNDYVAYLDYKVSSRRLILSKLRVR